MRFYHCNEQLSAQCAIGGTFLRRSLLILLQCQDRAEFLVLLETSGRRILSQALSGATALPVLLHGR